MAESGAFEANKFIQHIREHNQKIQYCGTNAHHQHGVAERERERDRQKERKKERKKERSIHTISNMVRAMLLHVSAHWKYGIDSSMWYMVVQYATYTYNILPRLNGICPNDIFFGTRS